MNEVQQYGSSRQLGTYASGGYTPSRALGKQLSRMEGTAMIRAVETDIEARMSALKLSAVASLGSSAQQQVAMLTQMEMELAKASPAASGRLDMLGTVTSLAMTEIVTDAAAKLRRL